MYSYRLMTTNAIYPIQNAIKQHIREKEYGELLKIAFITDTHLGVRNGSKVFRNLFREYYRDTLIPYLLEHEIKQVVHLGDFWDDRTKLNLQDLDYVLNEFIPLITENDITMYIVA